MTASISAVVSAMVTNRRPSLPIASKATTLFGPAETCGLVGGSGYAGSMTSSARSTYRRTRSSAARPATANRVAAAACPTSGVTGSAGRPRTFETSFGVPSAMANWTPTSATIPAPTAAPVPTARAARTGAR
ncbi:MAG: hypothetical protein MUF35_08860, partial [Candidatus Nanopelagicales bacterium]|nr:hypothetical protein [Candidatus Nanopelagicales bacterium]